ncbi:hypothetical protein [Bdellovibrio sp. HCB2-146]|uniref:hypothetical protein n=1 Tax=Bdellovibrio sp. HCB2-146 TaxID=3394362 RepID=UPI0039BCA5EA
MKMMIMALASLLSLNAFAGSSIENAARKQAFDFASKVFSNMADYDADFSVQLDSQNKNFFIYNAVATFDEASCSLQVFVNKKTGETFKVNDPICN